MRIARLIFVGSTVVSMAAFVTPAMAKIGSLNSHANANAHDVEEAPATQGCHAYQQAPDGSWVQVVLQGRGPDGSGPDARQISNPRT